MTEMFASDMLPMFERDHVVDFDKADCAVSNDSLYYRDNVYDCFYGYSFLLFSL